MKMNQSIISTQNRVIAGLLGGLLGGAALGIITPPPFGFVPYLIITGLLGAIFGLVFGPKINSTGAGFVWGEAFGAFWWLIGVLTLLPLASGQGLQWTLSAAREAFPLLIGHIMAYGTLMGLSYHLIVKQLAKMMPSEAATSIKSRTAARQKPRGQAIAPPIVQALIIGGIGAYLAVGSFFRASSCLSFLRWQAMGRISWAC